MAYVDTSKWDPEDLRAIEMAGVEWGNAYKDNDEAGMERAHEAAELIRAKYGYTGGADGSNLHMLHGITFVIERSAFYFFSLTSPCYAIYRESQLHTFCIVPAVCGTAMLRTLF